MGYLNTSMTKRAMLVPLLVGAGALGATGGGLAGYHGSDKTDNTPATVLGALGGGAGATAGTAAILPLAKAISNRVSDVNNINAKLLLNDADLYKLKKKSLLGPLDLDDQYDLENLKIKRKDLKRSFLIIPKWIHALHKHPGRHLALLAGGLGLGATAGGALGATLGVKGGDALA